MAALTVANAWVLIKTAVNLCQKTETYGRATHAGLHDAFVAANIGDYGGHSLNAALAHRANLSNMLTPAAVKAILAGPLAEMAAAINAPESGPPEVVMRRLYDYMIAL